jgi:GTP-binding protein HflX
MQALRERLAVDMFHQYMDLGPEQGQLRAQLYAQNAVLSETVNEDGRIQLEVRMQTKDLRRVLSRLNIPAERYLTAPEREW